MEPEGQQPELESRVVKIFRTATVKRGGKRFGFAALAVVGDRQGHVGFGYEKANEVPYAVEKAEKKARKSMISVPIVKDTLPHEVLGRFSASRVLIKPAVPGTGVKACAPVRVVLELAGVKNVLSKSLGNNNVKNLVKATFRALESMTTFDQVEKLRGVKLTWTSTK